MIGDGTSTMSASVVGLAGVMRASQGSPETGHVGSSAPADSELQQSHRSQQECSSVAGGQLSRTATAEAQYGSVVPSAHVQPTRGNDAINAVDNAIPRVSVSQKGVEVVCKSAQMDSNEAARFYARTQAGHNGKSDLP